MSGAWRLNSLHVFRCFPLDHHKPPAPGHSQQIHHAAVLCHSRYLRLEMARIELCIELQRIR
jgi:hypothetical protein